MEVNIREGTSGVLSIWKQFVCYRVSGAAGTDPVSSAEIGEGFPGRFEFHHKTRAVFVRLVPQIATERANDCARDMESQTGTATPRFEWLEESLGFPHSRACIE